MLAESNDIPDDYLDRLEVEYNLAIWGYMLYIPLPKEFNYGRNEVTTSEKEIHSGSFHSTGRGSKDH
jgi:hypothetical protein